MQTRIHQTKQFNFFHLMSTISSERIEMLKHGKRSRSTFADLFIFLLRTEAMTFLHSIFMNVVFYDNLVRIKKKQLAANLKKYCNLTRRLLRHEFHEL